MPPIWPEIQVDVLMFLGCVAAIGIYHLFLMVMVRRGHHYTFQAVVSRSRAAWAQSVMEGGRDILAVQTFRNSIMAATFLASTAIFLITGVLTLSTQGDRLEGLWHALNVGGGAGPAVWILKILAILVDLFAAFLCFTMVIRFFHHVAYMINVPLGGRHGAVAPRLVIAQLNRAGHFYWLGMRAYFFLLPLVLWLFGPLFMVGATAALIVFLYRLDHMPLLDEEAAQLPAPPAREDGKLVSLR